MVEMHKGLPVPGYVAQSSEKVGIVTAHKHYEERLLRVIDTLQATNWVDKRWLAIAKTDLEKGFMALNRAVFQPDRVRLPEDPVASEEAPGV